MKPTPLLLLPCLVAPVALAEEDLGVLLRRAREARNAGDWDGALKAYDAMLALVATHETALFERAQTLGWAGRHEASIQAWERFRGHFPGRSAEADLHLARVAAWGRQFDRALRTLEPYVRAGERQPILDSATYLGWAGRHGESLALTGTWLKTHPDDPDALLIHGRTASWAGRLDEARSTYVRLLALKPGHTDALAGLARVALWSGDPETARRSVERMPPESLRAPEQIVLLAQVELAEGHRRHAKARLRPLAEKEGPVRKDAVALLRGLATAQGPSLEVSHSRTDSNEDLATEESTATLRLPLWDGSLSLGGANHRADFLGQDVSVKAVNGGLAYPLGPVRLSGTAQRFSDLGGQPATGHTVGLGWRLTRGVELSLSRSLAWATYTPRAIERRVGIRGTDGALVLSSPSQSLRLSGGTADTTGGNTRTSAMLVYDYRWRIGGNTLTTGLLSRSLRYDRSLDLGFFNPERYRFHALTAGLSREEGGFSGSLGVRGGRQVVNQQPWKTAWGFDGDLAYRLEGTALVCFGAWSWSSAGIPVVAPGAAQEYRERTWRVGLRLAGPWR